MTGLLLVLKLGSTSSGIQGTKCVVPMINWGQLYGRQVSYTLFYLAECFLINNNFN